MRPQNKHSPARPLASNAVAIALVVGTTTLLTQRVEAKPKEIIIEAAPSPAPSKGPVSLTELERRALDNALVAGSVEHDAPLRITKAARKAEQEISVKSGRCYDVSVAWKGSYRTTITYSMQRTTDGRPLNDFSNSESGQSYPGEGIVHFCVDRSGTVKLEILADDTADAVREYAIVAAYRPESAAQADARRRRATAAQKQSAEAARQATPADSTSKK